MKPSRRFKGNAYHKFLKRGELLALEQELDDPNIPEEDKKKLARGIDEVGRTPLAVLAGVAQTHTNVLMSVAVNLVCHNLYALNTSDNHGDTPLDTGRKNFAIGNIIELLSLTPDAGHAMGWPGLCCYFVPPLHYRNSMIEWIRSRSYADCHKFITNNDDELVREVLKYRDSDPLREVACYSKKSSSSLVFLALRMIHRYPLSLTDTNFQGHTALMHAAHPQFNACKEIRKLLTLKPPVVSSTPFSALLFQFLPSKHHEIYGPYNTVCQFIKHMKYDKAELVEIEAVLEPTRKCDVCSSTPAKPCARCKRTFYCSAECQKSAWKKHKKMCKAPTSPPASEAELRVLHNGMHFLNRCIQENGAGDGPTSVVLEFL